MVQVADPAPVIVVGVHARALRFGAGSTVTVVVTLGLPEAVMVTDWLDVTKPAVAVKVILVKPAGTITDAGTPRAELLSLNVTAYPLPGAALVNPTVQVEEAPEITVDGEQASEERTAGATSENETVAEEPFSVALNTALASPVTAATVAVKAALDCPAATVTEAGIVKLELLSESATLVPPPGAAVLIVTVQAEDPAAVNVVGEQLSALISS
jgi:hypothetical protein